MHEDSTWSPDGAKRKDGEKNWWGLLSPTVRNVCWNDATISVGMGIFDSVFGMGILPIYGHLACTGHEWWVGSACKLCPYNNSTNGMALM